MKPILILGASISAATVAAAFAVLANQAMPPRAVAANPVRPANVAREIPAQALPVRIQTSRSAATPPAPATHGATADTTPTNSASADIAAFNAGPAGDRSKASSRIATASSAPAAMTATSANTSAENAAADTTGVDVDALGAALFDEDSGAASRMYLLPLSGAATGDGPATRPVRRPVLAAADAGPVPMADPPLLRPDPAAAAQFDYIPLIGVYR
ncbi:hypothetical protein [Paracoccus sp. S1E-3]|uniref:hypothetical protein n=1 Tax=Paracoccus sp. S1E-3 TaxID=2756130 RepID=UPI0015EF2BAA|nr:hypothetical protein [Paracoccus sp. S1E-3]MBA4492638.1 hypothetical protein [Paracoccus sp. S1E-3]